jgi:iron complex outermembrane receptor protein
MRPGDLLRKTLLAQAVLLCTTQLHAQQIEEVVVTATKRAESLQDVPVSVSAISGNELGQLGLRDTTQIAAQVPNMQISTPMGDSMPVIAIRGVSMDDFSLNQSSPVAIYVDEVYKGHPSLQSVQMYDLERLEVLRGPQGTLYGKNSTGGAVNFITTKPGFGTEGYVTAGYAEFDRKELQGAFETPIIDDTLAVRVAGTWTEMDGWKENKLAGGEDTNAIDEWGARMSLLYQPADALEMILRISGSKSEPVNYGYTPEPGPAGAGAGLYEVFNNTEAGLPALLGVTPPAGAPQQSYFPSPGVGDFDIEEDRTEERSVENTAVSLTVNWDLSESLALTSITSWDDGEFFSPEGDGTPNTILAIDYDSDVTQVSQDLRIASEYGGPINFIAGVFYSEEEVEAPVNIPLFTDLDLNVDGALDVNDCADPLLIAFGLGDLASPSAQTVEALLNFEGQSLALLAGSGCQLRNDYRQTRTSMALYFDGSYDITDALTARLGLRYNDDETVMDDFMAGYYGSDDILFAPTITQDTLPTDKIADDEWTGRGGLDYTTADGHLLYASYSHGYRNGAFNGQAFNDPAEMEPVEAETVDAIEVGFKSELFDRRIRLNGAAFYYDYSDQQFLDIDPATAAQRLINIDSSTIYGLELELTALVTDNFTVRSGLGLLDTEVDEGVVKGVDVEGNSLVQAPEVNFNLALDYDIPVGEAGFVQLHADTSYADDHYFDILNTELIEQEAYWVTNARISFYSADDRYSVSLWGKNLADELYATKSFDLSDFGYTMSHIGAPRMFGVEATLRF